MRAAVVVVALAMTPLLTACSGSTGDSGVGPAGSSSVASQESQVTPTDPSAQPTPAPLSTQEAEALLLTAQPAVRIGEPGSSLDEHLDDPVMLEVVRRHLDAGTATWADVYVWTNAGDDAAPLLPYLESGDVQIRTIAAIGAAARGTDAGLEVLIEALDDDDEFLADPPGPVWRVATTYLTVFTASATLGPPRDATETQRRGAQERWRAWLESSPTFDAGTGLWSAPS